MVYERMEKHFSREIILTCASLKKHTNQRELPDAAADLFSLDILLKSRRCAFFMLKLCQIINVVFIRKGKKAIESD